MVAVLASEERRGLLLEKQGWQFLSKGPCSRRPHSQYLSVYWRL